MENFSMTRDNHLWKKSMPDGYVERVDVWLVGRELGSSVPESRAAPHCQPASWMCVKG